MSTDPGTPTSYLQLLAYHRRFILLCEISAFLHDLDKLSGAFCKDKTERDKKKHEKIGGELYVHGVRAELRKKYLEHDGLFSADFRKVLEQWSIAPPDFLTHGLEKQFPNPVNAKETIILTPTTISLAEAFLTHHDGYKPSKGKTAIPIPGAFVNGGLCGADGLDSEVDKAVFGHDQTAGSAYIASPFGREHCRYEAAYLDTARMHLLKTLTDILCNSARSMRWVRGKIYERSQEAMSDGLGETHRATNDVRLYDHSFSVATLTKAIAAKVLIEALHAQPNDYKLPLRYHAYQGRSLFRVLSIMANTPAILARGMRIGDILGYRDRLNDLWKLLRRMFENTFPLGNVVYEDEYGIHLVLPAIESNEHREKFEQQIRDKIERLRCFFANDDIEFLTEFSGETQLLTVITDQRQRGLDSFRLPYGRVRPTWTSRWSRSAPIPTDLCVVCRHRQKADKETRCLPCLHRYQGRARIWLQHQEAPTGLSDHTTIWLGEVADNDNHVALVTAQLDLRRWLSGDFVSTMLAEDIFAQGPGRDEKQKKKDEKRGKRIEAITQLIGGTWNPENNDTGIFAETAYFDKATLAALKGDVKVGEGQYLAAFVDKNLEERNLKNVAQDDRKKALLFATIKKQPSGGRLRRIKEEARTFWEACQSHFLATEQAIGSQRTMRLRLWPKETLKNNLSPSLAYDLDAAGKKLAVFFDGKAKCLLSIDNLARELGKDFSFEQIRKQILRGDVRLKRTDRDGDRLDREDSIGRLENVTIDPQPYIPLIPILLTPTTLQFLAPAVSVPGMVQHIQQQYEEHFGKVRNRLPLHIGVVVFKQRFPLYQAMNAAERMMRTLQKRSDKTWKEKTWSVVSNEQANSGKAMSLTLQTDRNERQVNWQVDVTLGGGQVPDEFYPYVQVKLNERTLEREKRKFFHARVEKRWSNWVHVKDLKKDDMVRVTPLLD
jgi:CRISPR-associated Csx11 family protein